MFILLLSGRGGTEASSPIIKNASFHEIQQVKHFFHAEWGGDCHARRHAENPFINLDKIEAGKGADERAGDASLSVETHALPKTATGRKVTWCASSTGI